MHNLTGLISKKKIFWIGTHHTTYYTHTKQVVLSNQLSILFAFIGILFAILFYGIGAPGLIAICCIGIGLMGGSLTLNYLGKFTLSNHLIMFTTTLVIYLLAILTGKELGAQYGLTVLFPLATTLFKPHQKKHQVFAMSLPFMAFIVLETSHYYTPYKIMITPFFSSLVSISYFITTSAVLYFMFQFYYQLFEHVQNNLKQALTIYPLTEREIDLMTILIEGKNNIEIAKQLDIEESTVKNHLKNIFKKLQVKSRSELIVKCIQRKKKLP